MFSGFITIVEALKTEKEYEMDKTVQEEHWLLSSIGASLAEGFEKHLWREMTM